MTQTTDAVPDDRAIKAKHRAMWALGNYHAVSVDVIAPLGTALADAAGVGPGDRVLDVAAGSGNASIPAARTGARVTASDLTPELVETGRQLSAAEGLDITWETGDVEHLPYGDAEFDAVLSCVGAMFAPHHQETADEIVRVCRPGGTIGLISWTPEGFIGQMFAVMKPYAAPPPSGAQPPPLWGREEHVRSLFGDRVTSVSAAPRQLTVDAFETPEDFRDYFKANYGPTIAAYRNVADDPERTSALDRDLVALAERFDRGDNRTVLDWEYLLFTAQRAGA